MVFNFGIIAIIPVTMFRDRIEFFCGCAGTKRAWRFYHHTRCAAHANT